MSINPFFPGERETLLSTLRNWVDIFNNADTAESKENAFICTQILDRDHTYDPSAAITVLCTLPPITPDSVSASANDGTGHLITEYLSCAKAYLDNPTRETKLSFYHARDRLTDLSVRGTDGSRHEGIYYAYS